MSKSNKILLVEDDKELNELLTEFLQLENFSVTSTFDGAEGIEKALQNDYDAIVLDIMLPKVNGLEVLKQLRNTKKTPVLMLTARGDEVDRIIGFEMGADDYLPKPCNPREIIARIKAILRRVDMDREDIKPSPSNGLVKADDIELNPATRVATLDAEVLELTSTEFNLLENLLANAGSVLSKEELTESALGRKLTLYDRSIDMHLSNLRRKLGPFADGKPRIKTVRGIGYLYVAN
ncbi:MAG: DNA-binding response regulator [Oceanospirillaceae bacterium]|jgi:two-component system response regulator CpxR|nr:DNA-binding response regulator [Oceanospirillaceae bacterium]HCI01976.1 DNA-binding response regulator [Oceanospirillaceae bacterium]|tara:strand:+ start:2674 stop:3381 length:708 start_codon:yes stop_codon:yes gene_type:complete